MSIISIKCEACKTPHHDYFECNECGLYLGYVLPRCGRKGEKVIKYCPNCGVALRRGEGRREMSTIWKYVFHLNDKPQIVSMPKGALYRFVGIDPDRKEPAVWFEVVPGAERETRTFTIHGTGHSLSPYERYVGSVIDGAFVWHVFEALV